MTEPNLEGVWERLQSGRHAALVGVPMPMIPGEFRPIRISCDVPPSTLGPLYEARRRLEAVLGEQPLLEQARDRVLHGLRRSLFGDAPTAEIDATLVDLGNRLADLGGRRSLLIFEVVEAADPPTLAILRQMILRPGWMRLPILLVFRTREPAGPAGALLNALLRAGGFGAVVQAAAGDSVTATHANAGVASLAGLPRGPLEVLRAGALIGSGFEVELCAALLGREPLAILLDLQAAADHKVPLEDRGEGRIHLPPPIVQVLREGITPSLAAFWHRRLAALLSDAATSDDEAAAAAAAGDGNVSAALLSAAESATPGRAIRAHAVGVDEPTRVDAMPAGERDTVVAAVPIEALHGVPSAPPIVDPVVERGPGPGDSFDAAKTLDLTPEAGDGRAPEDAPERGPKGPPHTPQAHTSSPPASHRHRRSQAAAEARGEAPRSTPTSATGEPRSRRHRRSHDAARAASHLSAVGEGDAAALRYVEAAREAAREGLGAQALSHGRRALSILERLPPSDARRRVRIAALVELARVQWRTLGDDAHLTLETALSTARQAQSALTAGDPPALQAEVALLIAGVAYDRGDLRALEEALGALSAASQALLNAGDPRGAATLLNDQAALYIRLGDHVRATHLLVSSRQIFEDAEPDDPVALRELGETHHLLARVPLHARARPGRESDALSVALDHAIVAEKLYRGQGDARAVARVWETMGRIEIRKGRFDRAGQRLAAALEVQRSIGDAIGMARTTAALADLLAEGGQLQESLGLLMASIGLNREKGSPLGLGLNRRALQRLQAKVGDDREAGATLARAVETLEAAEELLGRYPLPQSVDDAGP